MTEHTKDDDGDQYHFRQDLRPGDVVHDLGQRGWAKMRIVRQESDSVGAYVQERGTDLRDYEANALAGARDGDRVFLATYLQDSPMDHASTHYPVPESRIAKQDLFDQASHIGDPGDTVFHPADQAVLDFLTDALTELKLDGDMETAHTLKDVALAATENPHLSDMADDVSQSRVNLDAALNAEPTPDGGAEPDEPDANPGDDSDDSDDSGLEDFGDFDPDGDGNGDV